MREMGCMEECQISVSLVRMKLRRADVGQGAMLHCLLVQLGAQSGLLVSAQSRFAWFFMPTVDL